MNNVDLISEAPNGIEGLRAYILKLAVSGKLTSLNNGDETTEVLLKKIEEEKKLLLKRQVLNIGDISVSVKNDLLEIPLHWKCLELKDVFYSISPGNKKIKTREYEATGKFPIIDQGQEFIAGYLNDEQKVIRIPGPVIIFGDHTRIIKYVDFDFVPGADGVKVLRPIGLYERYFYLYLKSLTLEDRGYSRHFKVLNKQLFALPSFEEQKRIVAKVDQLMALCDELEAKQEKQTRTRRQLNDAALNALLSTASPDEFEKHWQRIVDNFDLLYDDLENLQSLRQTILDLAFKGKLTQFGKFVELPGNWKLGKIGENFDVVTGSTPPTNESSNYSESETDCPFFKPTDLNFGLNVKSASSYISERGKEYCRLVPAKTVSVTCIGATIGKTGLLQVGGTTNQQINSIVPNQNFVPEFVYFYCLSNTFQTQIINNASSTTLPILSKGKFEELEFPRFSGQPSLV